MHRKRRLNIQDLNPHLICVLCGGYFIDATTIIECLHSFCRACIVQHLEGSKYCPICDVQVHKTKPLQNIRQDPALQDIVYKLVPGLFQNEMRCRREFLSRHPDTVLPSSSSTISATDPSSIYTPDEKFNITLEYWKCSNSRDSHISQEDEANAERRRYLRCPGAVSISHLHKLIQAKFDLSPTHIIEFLYKDELLQDYLTLMDIAYIYKWKRKGPLNLTYRIIECTSKRIKLNNSNVTSQVTNDSLTCTNSSHHSSDNRKCDKIPSSVEKSSDWKEVQLQISETGIMSVTGITLEDNNALSTNNTDDSVHTVADTSACKTSEALVPLSNKSTLPELENNHKNEDKNALRDPNAYKSQLTKLGIQPSDSPLVQICQTETLECNNNSKELVVLTEPVPVESSSVSRTLSQQCAIKEVMPKRCNAKVDVTAGSTTREPTNHNPQTVKSFPVMVVAPTQNVKKINSGSMGYKTLKVPPKTWNPSITRSSYLHSKNQASNVDSNVNVSNVNPLKSSEKAPRFFKMRNMPRYLGNPASGVKPMYQVAGNSKAPNPTPTPKNKPIVMKIDPKTLSPIVSSNSSPGPQNKAFYNTSQSTTESQVTTNVLGCRDPGKTIYNTTRAIADTSRTTPTTGTSSTMISSTNVSHSANFALNSATLNMLASNPSFLPNATNFLYGNFTNFAPPLLRAGFGPASGAGLGAYHAMPPSINMFFPHHRSGFPAHPPAVQRIPPSKNNGHKLHNNNTLNLNKSPLQANADCCPIAKSNVLNPKNGIDSKQIKKSTDSTSFKSKNSQNDGVSSANQQINHLELNIINNNNNNNGSTMQNSVKNNEMVSKSSIVLASVSGKDEEDVTEERTSLNTQSRTEHSRIGSEVLEYDKDEDCKRDKPEKLSSKACIITEGTLEEEKLPLALCPVTVKTDKTCYSGQKSDTKSKDTIEKLQEKT